MMSVYWSKMTVLGTTKPTVIVHCQCSHCSGGISPRYENLSNIYDQCGLQQSEYTEDNTSWTDTTSVWEWDKTRNRKPHMYYSDMTKWWHHYYQIKRHRSSLVCVGNAKPVYSCGQLTVATKQEGFPTSVGVIETGKCFLSLRSEVKIFGFSWDHAVVIIMVAYKLRFYELVYI